MVFIDFAMVFMFVIVLAEIYLVFIHFSTMPIDFWIDLVDFLMIFIFIVFFNHSSILDGVAWFKVILPKESIDVATVFINCHVFIDSCMAFQSVFRDTRCTQQ